MKKPDGKTSEDVQVFQERATDKSYGVSGREDKKHIRRGCDRSSSVSSIRRRSEDYFT